MSRYRGRHGSSRAKSDRGEAKVLADLVRIDHHHPVAGDSPLAEAVKVPGPGRTALVVLAARTVLLPGALCAATAVVNG